MKSARINKFVFVQIFPSHRYTWATSRWKSESNSGSYFVAFILSTVWYMLHIQPENRRTNEMPHRSLRQVNRLIQIYLLKNQPVWKLVFRGQENNLIFNIEHEYIILTVLIIHWLRFVCHLNVSSIYFLYNKLLPFCGYKTRKTSVYAISE